MFFLCSYRLYFSKSLKVVLLLVMLCLRFFWCLEIQFFGDFVVLCESWGVDSFRAYLIFLRVLIYIFVIVFTDYVVFVKVSLTLAILSFCTMNFLFFFILFELSIIPLFFLIFSRGKNPERVISAVSLWVYTLVGGFPLLFNIVKIYPCFFIFGASMDYWSDFFYQSLFWLVAFFIKVPLFGFHKWLPLAHVEAPSYGSIVLAAIMLKLGAYGLFRVFGFLWETVYVNLVILWFFMLGFFWSRFFCLLRTDIKALIAYSRIAHMNFFLTCFLFQKKERYFSGLIILFTHGVVRGGLFFLFNFLYLISGSRSYFINYSVGLSIPSFVLIWGIFCVLNSSVPPNPAIISEIFLSRSLFYIFGVIIFVVFFVGFILCGLFRIYLFLVIMGGKKF